MVGITETTPIPTNYDEENLIKEYCITETTPIPTNYDKENVIKEYCITETTPIPTDAAFFDNVLSS
jgi:hypothetical protein